MIGTIFVLATLGTTFYFINKQDNLKEKQKDLEQQERKKQKIREQAALNISRKMYFEQNYQQPTDGYMGYEINGYLHTSGSWYRGW